MKHNIYKYLAVFMLTASLTAGAKAPQFSEPVRIDLAEESFNPVLSPDGKTMLFSSTSDHFGLNAINLESGEVTMVSDDNAASFNPVFSDDSRTVYYRTATISDGLMCHQWNSFSLGNKASSRLSAPSRKDLTVNDVANAPVKSMARADWDHIELTLDNVKTNIKPIADAHSYLWASLSPDKSKVMFTEPFEGVFVCDNDGSNPVKVIAKGDYPTWLSDRWVLAIVSHDDGYIVLSSKLFAIDLTTGKKIQISPDNVLVGEVTACPATATAAYATMDGEIFMFNLK